MRVLTAEDKPQLLDLIEQNPAVNVFVHAAVLHDKGRELWGYFNGATLESALHVGSNIVPVAVTESAARDFAFTLRARQRTYSSIVGPKPQVDLLWSALETKHGPARLIRHKQPYLMLDASPVGKRQLTVRKATSADLDSYFKAAVDMFTSEVEFDPTAHGAGAFRARILETIADGRSFGWFDHDGRTLFKVDVGAIAKDTCQLQGVWLSPELRGQGLATPLLAAAIDEIQRDIAPRICLYVNDFNHAALRAYARLGFHAIAEFATIFM